VVICNPILGDCGWNVFHNITKDLEMFTLVVGHRIWVHYKKVNMKNFYTNHKIWNENILSCENLIKALIDSNNGNKQNKVNNVWISQRKSKFNFVWAITGLFCDILTINVLYWTKTFFKGSNIDIHHVLTFLKILNPFVSTILGTLRVKTYKTFKTLFKINIFNFLIIHVVIDFNENHYKKFGWILRRFWTCNIT
jgi:hypothetical protein